MTKKAQMEILGLAVIIILITLAGLFVLRFVVLKPVEIKTSYTMKSLAVDTLTAMLRTNTECYGETVKDLLMDCAESYTEKGDILCENGQFSCQFVKDMINTTLAKTLKTWNRNYIFNASTRDKTLMTFSNGGCKAAKMIEPAIQPLPTSNNLEVRLDVCE